MKRHGVFALWLVFLALSGCAAPFSVRHRVGPREDLAAIAARYGVTERDLRAFNHLQGEDRVRPGDIVFVPGGGVPTPARPAVPAPVPSSPPRVVERPTTVQPPPVSQAKLTPPPHVPAPSPAPQPAPSPPVRTARPETAPAREGRQLRWPASGEVLRGFGTSPAGESRGIDLGLAQGSAVRAAAAGTVTYAGTPAEAYGPLVIIEHEGGLFTVYGNLSGYRVDKGQQVDGGAEVGRSGGKHGDLPPHLHFEVREGQRAVDPLLFLPPR